MTATAILLDMSNKKRTAKKTGRARDIGEAVPLNVELPLSLDDALDQYTEKEGRSKKWVVSRALEDFFRRVGVIPPSDNK
jgi:hypothetical protein